MPEKVGLIEIFKDEPKFTTEELRKIVLETTTYFPKDLFEIILVDPFIPICVKEKDLYEYEVLLPLKEVKDKNGMDKIVGISRGINYLGTTEGSIFHGGAFPQLMVAICDEIRKFNGLPKNVAHEIGHLYGLYICNYEHFLSNLETSFEKTDPATKFLYMMILDELDINGRDIRRTCEQLRKIASEDKQLEPKLKSIYANCHERGYIMCSGSRATKNSFSSRDYAHLESLVK